MIVSIFYFIFSSCVLKMAANILVSSNYINCVSYNLHGFNQGITYLTSLCSSNIDLILLQETWLINESFLRLCDEFKTNYTLFCSSSMDERLSAGLLKGRPFGGLAIMVHNKLVSSFSRLECIKVNPNFLIIKADKLLIINVYLPSVISYNVKDSLILILDEIVDTCLNFTDCHVLCGGDYNCNVTLKNSTAELINSKLYAIDVSHCFNYFKSNLDSLYSFAVPNRNAYSLIDFFFCSEAVGKAIVSVDIVDHPDNFSDHLPVHMSFSSDSLFFHPPNHSLPIPSTQINLDDPNNDHISFIWDDNCKSHYYELTRLNFADLQELCAKHSLSDLLNLMPDLFTAEGANSLYKNFVHMLLNCSMECFEICSSIKKSTSKWWWDPSLKKAKARSLNFFMKWKYSGFVINTPEHQSYLQVKKEYKNLIQVKKREASGSLSDKLLNSLTERHAQKFWRIWQSTFKTQNNSHGYAFNNLNSDLEIANHLASSHRENCSPNNKDLDESSKADYYDHKILFNKSNVVEKLFIDNDLINKAIQKIANGTAAGHDNIYVEHFKFAHPSVPFIFKTILNIFLMIDEVPLDFGLGLVTPIPKFKGCKKHVTEEDFRGITLNVIPSKIFEHCILPSLVNLPSSQRQFGFKKGLSCLNAISIVRKTCQYFNSKGNTVSAALVDIKKAFDKSSFWGILRLLQKHSINPNVINILEHWFLISTARTKWNNVLSDPVVLLSGVRQGGILSPLLFSAYIDTVLSKLESSSLGCFINKRCFNSFLYADDLILLSISVSDLQDLLNTAVETFESLNLKINSNKTVCLRVGSRFMSPCKLMSAGGSDLSWVDEAKYLGIFFKSGKKLSCNWQSARSSYYKALNSLLSVLGSNPSIQVALALIRASCFPILTYGLAALHLSPAEQSQFTFVYNCVFAKLFSIKEVNTIEQCQFFCNFWPFRVLYEYHRFNFLKLCFANTSSCNFESPDYEDFCDLINIAEKYSFNMSDSKGCVKFKIWKFLEHSLL